MEDEPDLTHAWQDFLVARIRWEERSRRGISRRLVDELAWTAFKLIEFGDRGDGGSQE